MKGSDAGPLLHVDSGGFVPPSGMNPMVAKFSALGGKRDVDIAFLGLLLALWSLYVPEK